MKNLNSNNNEPMLDLTLKCKKCHVFLNIDELSYHSTFHSMLNYFGYNEISEVNVKNLTTRKNEIQKLIQDKQTHVKNFSSSETESTSTRTFNYKLKQLYEYYEILKELINNRSDQRFAKPYRKNLFEKGIFQKIKFINN